MDCSLLGEKAVCLRHAHKEKVQASRLLGEFAQLHSDRVTAAPRHATDSVSIPQTHTASRWSSHCRRPGIGPPDYYSKEICYLNYFGSLTNTGMCLACVCLFHALAPLPVDFLFFISCVPPVLRASFLCSFICSLSLSLSLFLSLLCHLCCPFLCQLCPFLCPSCVPPVARFCLPSGFFLASSLLFWRDLVRRNGGLRGERWNDVKAVQLSCARSSSLPKPPLNSETRFVFGQPMTLHSANANLLLGKRGCQGRSLSWCFGDFPCDKMEDCGVSDVIMSRILNSSDLKK